MHKLRENAERELQEIAEKGLSPSNLDNAYKLTEIVKGIDKIEMMKEGGYSQARGGYSREGGNSNYGGGNSNYSREGGGNSNYSQGRDYSRDGYSQEGGNSNYSREGGYSREEYDNGNSYRRGRNQNNGQYMHRSNYSRLSGDNEDMERYRQRKQEYSNSRDAGSKEQMLVALEDFMCGIHGMLKQIFKDSDTREEREIVQKYAREIAEM